MTNYFKQIENFVKHLSTLIETIKYNVMKKITNKYKKNKINFECNKRKNFFIKKNQNNHSDNISNNWHDEFFWFKLTKNWFVRFDQLYWKTKKIDNWKMKQTNFIKHFAKFAKFVNTKQSKLSNNRRKKKTNEKNKQKNNTKKIYFATMTCFNYQKKTLFERMF